MQQFRRALKLIFRYRWTIVGIVASSVLVATFWGLNIGTLYPFIKVALSDRSLKESVDEDIQLHAEKIDKLRKQLSELPLANQIKSPDRRREVGRQRARIASALLAQQKALSRLQWVRPAIDRYMPDTAFQTIVLIVVALLAGTIIKCIFIFVNRMLVARLVQLVMYDIRRQFFHHSLHMDLSEFGTERTSGLLSRFNADIGYLTAGLSSLFGSAMREPLKIIACLIGAAIISPRLLLFSLLLTPLVGFVIQKLGGSIKRANRRAMEEISQLYGVLTETFNGIQTVQAYTLEPAERKKFHKVAKECLHKGMRIAFYGAFTKPATEVMGISVICLALLAGAYVGLNEQLHLLGIKMFERPPSFESLLVFYSFLIGTAEPARKLSGIFNSIQGGFAAAERLFPLLDRQPKIVSPTNPKSLPSPHKSLVLNDVSFYYVDDQPVLSGIDLNIRFGETIAFVGPNGCGKTTLVNLIPRFFDPVTGSVQLDGIDIRDVRLRDLRQNIGLVNQQALLFDDTVVNNIRCGWREATEADVIRAAKQARAHSFITEKLEHGYETCVGMGGNRLSGGQRQRICLARAILRDPEILILDEATSQIDLESEQLIHQALEQFKQGRTALIITHRLATLSLADRVVVMDVGRIVDIGSHQELMGRCSLYQRLHAIQFQQSA